MVPVLAAELVANEIDVSLEASSVADGDVDALPKVELVGELAFATGSVDVLEDETLVPLVVPRSPVVPVPVSN